MTPQTKLLRTERAAFLRRCILSPSRLLVVLVLALASFSCSGSDDYDLFASLYGKVTDEKTGEPLANASVMLLPSGISLQTSDDGLFLFDNLDAQQYTVLVQKDGYQTNRKTVAAVSGERAEVNIQLVPIPN